MIWLILGTLWLVCAGLALWMMARIDGALSLGELVMCMLFAPLALFVYLLIYGEEIVIWRKK